MPALLLLTATGFSGFAALLPTAPLWAVGGGADAAGAGSVNAVLMLCTVLARDGTPPTTPAPPSTPWPAVCVPTATSAWGRFPGL